MTKEARYAAVKRDLEDNHWTLLSTEYKNISVPLQMRCPKGHEVSQTYENWRAHKRCDICMVGAPFQSKFNGTPLPKDPNKKRVLALDGATHVSGFAIYDGEELIHYGTYATKGKDTTERINQVKKWLLEMIEGWKPDYVGVEHIQLQIYDSASKNPQVEMYRKLANLQGVVFDALYELSMPASLVYPVEWRAFCGITGKKRPEQKEKARELVRQWYGLKCTEDEADAICIGKYFAITLAKEEE